MKKLVGDDEVLKKVVGKIVEMNEDKELIGVYDKEVEDVKILRTRLISAHNEGKLEGEKIGYDLGQKSGYTKGEKSGYEMGMIKWAKSLIRNNTDINKISSLTGLSKSKIKDLDINS